VQKHGISSDRYSANGLRIQWPNRVQVGDRMVLPLDQVGEQVPRATQIHVPASASAFRTTLDSDSRNVANASSLSCSGAALSNGPISVISGLKPSTGRTTGKETPPILRLRSAGGLAQSRPDPYPPNGRLEPSFARLVPSPRQPPVVAPGPPGARPAARTPSARPLIKYECLIRQTRRRQRE
jgi:hypothetical protein